MTGPSGPSPRGSSRHAARICAAVVLALTAGCVPASPDANTFRDQAGLTVGAGVSEVATVRMSLHALARRRTSSAAALVAFRYSEKGLATAAQSFTALNPPIGEDRLYYQVDTLLDDAADLLARARIAVERGRIHQYGELVDQLGRLGQELETVEKQVTA